MLRLAEVRNGRLVYTYRSGPVSEDGYVSHYDVKQGMWIVGVRGHEDALELEVEITPDGFVRTAAKRGEHGIWHPLDDRIKIGIEAGVERFKALVFDRLARGMGESTITL
ncbi:hypothetical protein ACFONN_19105 [Dyella humi]|uniref:Uncharacterized protein n=1 Tax=Dyella humi TaxID=1770547 RepID=A0ABW8IEC0_9GAMM